VWRSTSHFAAQPRNRSRGEAVLALTLLASDNAWGSHALHHRWIDCQIRLDFPGPVNEHREATGASGGFLSVADSAAICPTNDVLSAVISDVRYRVPSAPLKCLYLIDLSQLQSNSLRTFTLCVAPVIEYQGVLTPEQFTAALREAAFKVSCR